MTTFIGANLTWPANNGGAPSSAQFQAAVAQLKNGLSAIGLVQTSDTGQLNEATITFPGSAETDAGYMIFRFSDAAQGTDPVFIKIWVGHGTNYLYTFRVRYQVGQGSNGSGTLTGVLSSAHTLNPAQANGSNSTQLNPVGGHYMSFAEGALFVGTFYNYGATSGTGSRIFSTYFSVERTRGDNGALDGLGVSLLHGGSPSNNFAYMQSVRWTAPTAVYNTHNQGCLIPAQPANTALENGDKQLYPHFGNWPQIVPRWSSFTVRNSEFGTNPTTFTASPVHGIARTFIHFGTAGNGPLIFNGSNDANFGPCFLWE